MTSLNLTLGDTRLLINTCKRHKLLRNQCAYVLATSYHETAHSMRPIREMGGEAYLRKKKYYPYVGMGYVQLTWKENYAKASEKLGVDFVANPKLLLDKRYASEILVVGMLQGWFTTRKLSDYITLYKSDFVGARRIINGTDKSATISGYAKQYDALLKAEGYGEGKPSVETYPPHPGIFPPLTAEQTGPMENKPVVVHVEQDGTVKPGPSDKPPYVERNPWWIAVWAVLKAIFGVGK